VRYNCEQEIASHSSITSGEFLSFLKEQCLSKMAKIEEAKKKKEGVLQTKKCRLEVLTLKKLDNTKKKEEEKRRHEEMKLQRETAKQQREAKHEATKAKKAMKSSKVTSKGTKTSSSRDQIIQTTI
jgi:hypothetical protein